MTTSSIGLLGWELLKESKNIKDTVVSSENQQSDTASLPPFFSQQEFYIKDLKSYVLIYWNGQISKEVRDVASIAGKAKIFKTYTFYKTIRISRAAYTHAHLYIMDATFSQSNSLGNYKVTLEFFPSKIANTREVLMKAFSDGYQSDIAYRR